MFGKKDKARLERLQKQADLIHKKVEALAKELGCYTVVHSSIFQETVGIVDTVHAAKRLKTLEHENAMLREMLLALARELGYRFDEQPKEIVARKRDDPQG